MNQATEISKKAFLARLNELRQRAAVDTEYETINGETKLILVLEDGSRQVFEGLRAA